MKKLGFIILFILASSQIVFAAGENQKELERTNSKMTKISYYKYGKKLSLSDLKTAKKNCAQAIKELLTEKGIVNIKSQHRVLFQIIDSNAGVGGYFNFNSSSKFHIRDYDLQISVSPETSVEKIKSYLRQALIFTLVYSEVESKDSNPYIVEITTKGQLSNQDFVDFSKRINDLVQDIIAEGLEPSYLPRKHGGGAWSRTNHCDGKSVCIVLFGSLKENFVDKNVTHFHTEMSDDELERRLLNQFRF